MIEKLKTMAMNAIENGKNAITKGKVALGAAVGTIGAGLTVIAASAEGGEGAQIVVPSIADKVTTADFQAILTQLTDLIPVALPVIVAGLAIRKGVSFLRSLIRGI